MDRTSEHLDWLARNGMEAERESSRTQAQDSRLYAIWAELVNVALKTNLKPQDMAFVMLLLHTARMIHSGFSHSEYTAIIEMLDTIEMLEKHAGG